MSEDFESRLTPFQTTATVAAAGDTSGATQGFSTASVPQESARVTDLPVPATGGENDDNDKKKKNKPISLAQRISRVTVLLPQSSPADSR